MAADTVRLRKKPGHEPQQNEMSLRYFGVTLVVAAELPWMPADKIPLNRFRKALEKRFANWSSRSVKRGEFYGLTPCDTEIFEIWRLSKRQYDALGRLISRYLPRNSHVAFVGTMAAEDPTFDEEVNDASD